METANQLLRQSQNELQRNRGLTDKPFAGHVSAVNYRTEQFTVVTPTQTRTLDYMHPYVGYSAWIRSSPEPTIKPLIQYRGDRPQPTILRYLQEGNESRIKQFGTKVSVYRPLRPGEIELNSKGLAQAYFAERAINERKAGVVKEWLNQDELEAGQKSPLHIRQFISHKSGEMGDEIREGVVKRWTSAIKTFFPKIKNNFAKEIYVRLKSFSGTPKFLLYKREGQVLNDAGAEELHGTTSKPLRVKHIYYTKDDTEVAIELDELGNFEVRLPDAATEGGILKIPKGGLKFQLGSDFNIIGDKGMKAIFKSEVSYEASGAKARLGNGRVAFGASGIELLQKISDALDKIATWAGTTGATHTHIGNLGIPTLAPMEAAQYIQLQGDLTKLKVDIDTIKGSL